MTDTVALQEAVDQVYTAFADYPKPQRIRGCLHCRPADADRPLLNRPVRRLDAHVLGEYVYSAMHTWGTAADFRYVVPRVVDLLVTGRFDYCDIEIVFDRIRRAEWTDWREDRREAVSEVLSRFWACTLSTYPGVYDIDDLLCGLGLLLDDLTPYLRRWIALETEAAALHLRAFVQRNIGPVVTGRRLWCVYWSPQRLHVAEQVIDWLLSPQLKHAVEDAYLRDPSPDAVEALGETDRWL